MVVDSLMDSCEPRYCKNPVKGERELSIGPKLGSAGDASGIHLSREVDIAIRLLRSNSWQKIVDLLALCAFVGGEGCFLSNNDRQ